MYEIQDVNDIDAAFGTKALSMMPEYKDIPDEFKKRSNKWNKFVSSWFFCGVKNLKLKPKEGVSEEKAFRHIRTIIKSFEPKHEHKEAGVAFLFNEWFEDVEYEVAEGE